MAVPTIEEPTVNALVLRPFYEMMANQPQQLDALLKPLGLSADKLPQDESNRIPLSLIRQSLKKIMAISPDPDLGIKIGAMLRPGHLGSLSYLLMSCVDYEDLSKCLCDYYDIILAGVVDLKKNIDSQGCGVIEIIPSDTVQDLLEVRQGLSLTATVGLLRHSMPAGYKPLRVEFPWKKPNNNIDYKQLIGAADVLFEQKKLAIYTAPQWLNSPLPNANPSLKKMFKYELDRLLSDIRSNSTITERIYRYLASRETLKSASVDEVAEALHMSQRTLHRQLGDTDTNFRDLLNVFRATKAVKMLSEGSLVDEIVYYLGFSERAAFDRAFKSWLGITAAAFQKEYRLIPIENTIEELVSGDKMPILPVVATRLLESMGKENVSLAELASIVEMDPALTFKLLGLANSAMFGLSRVVNIEQAMSKVFGVNSLRSIAIAMLANNTFQPIKWGGFSPENYWHSAFSVGYLSVAIAKKSKLNNLSVADVYLCGLMHNIGLLYLINHLPKNQVELLLQVESMPDLTRLEISQQQNALIGTNTCAVGSMLCVFWNMPRFLGLSIRQASKLSAAEEFFDSGFLLASVERAVRHSLNGGDLVFSDRQELIDNLHINPVDFDGILDAYVLEKDKIKELLANLIG
jgi:HD-like signal output (HDOD) protein/AraC-like DNA-binding protein